MSKYIRLGARCDKMAQPVFWEMVRPVVASLDNHSAAAAAAAATSLLCVALYLVRTVDCGGCF